jgi:hypothetical protein
MARQIVQLRDRDGRLWMATDILNRSSDALLRIRSCAVTADSGKPMT